MKDRVAISIYQTRTIFPPWIYISLRNFNSNILLLEFILFFFFFFLFSSIFPFSQTSWTIFTDDPGKVFLLSLVLCISFSVLCPLVRKWHGRKGAKGLSRVSDESPLDRSTRLASSSLCKKLVHGSFKSLNRYKLFYS